MEHILRCTCCNRPLKVGEWNKKTPDGRENTFCNVCINASVDVSTTFKDPQLLMCTDQLFPDSMTRTKYVE